MTKEDLKNQIELLVKDDESSQQTIINQRQEIERLNKQIEEYQKALDETTSEKIDLENIIEEDKKIEKIPYQFNLNYIDSKLDSYTKEEINHIYDKINEIIDKLNEMEKE